MRTATVALAGACGVLPGLLTGLAVRLAAAEALPEERASAAVVVVLGLSVALGPSAILLRRGGAFVPLAAGLAGALASAVAGSAAGALGAGVVVAGAAALGWGAASALRRLRVPAPGAALAGVALPALLCASVLVADPLVEWDGSGPRSTQVARWVYRTSAVAAATSPAGGTGVDWQTRPLLYDGHGAGGLSVIGQYYPSRPPSARVWGVTALAIGGLLALAGRAGRPRATPG